ncbi:YMEL1-like protein [Mya arenaria]|uniref:YMEL1-like protein n=1 Tax=Mya arenaria TaxID=6604 RepID=A0ABY7E3F3_MYAAR|nr:YMEL1-like protein [Mya arenaria]
MFAQATLQPPLLAGVMSQMSTLIAAARQNIHLARPQAHRSETTAAYTGRHSKNTEEKRSEPVDDIDHLKMPKVLTEDDRSVQKKCDEVKEELMDIVSFLKDNEKFEKMGEANVPFFHASGSQFDEVFVGSGSKRVRALFEEAKKQAPCIIFIDEIDSVGGKRTKSSIHPYANQTVNQLLAEMDGFNTRENVIVIGATNEKGNLDKALLRPGRFDTQIEVLAPDMEGRKQLFELYLSKIKTRNAGAEIQNMVNQGAIIATLRNGENITMDDLHEARDKVAMALPTREGNTSKSECLASMDLCMGGRAAEELQYGADNVEAGAASDFERGTMIAKAMVMKWGMSDKEAYERAMNILKSHQTELKRLAEALMKYETLDADEIKAIIEGKSITRRPRDKKKKEEKESSVHSVPNYHSLVSYQYVCTGVNIFIIQNNLCVNTVENGYQVDRNRRTFQIVRPPIKNKIDVSKMPNQ